eukprot:Hpha_TRINITY_DN11971_c0_g1::TRINITY_DN11971_c0_g1_i3::g.20651::m.20651
MTAASGFDVRSEGGVAVVTMADTEGMHPWGTPKAEHRWNPVSVEGLHSILDTLEADQTVQSLVVAAKGKFWSNGMDLQWVDQASPEEGAQCNRRLNDLMARVLCFPVPTVAAFQGHWCAAGGMFGLCFDYRVMANNRGYFFVPGVDLGIVYSPFQTELMKAKLPQPMHRDVIVLNLKRWKATELVSVGVVDETCPGAETEKVAVAAASRLCAKGRGAARKALQPIKQNVYSRVLSALSDRPEMTYAGRQKGSSAYAVMAKI